ncbi:outer envelope protein 61-like isoform X1 [Iris pallida]|uniref:Outer envelope protein 61-like isoform X1 n=1 Tax=Iris pallida TaxID=29817 RepID=A0AAX6E1E1_IRIPA|nr:outer envelope protein 61-like isoform X1 [Iris pallida]
MYNMMDPELMRIAQEQMSRISPEELARIQRQMISNPELMRIASESMKNMSPEDLKRAAEQMKHTRAEDMAEMSEKVSKATPEELAAMRARVDAQISYEMNAAQMLKQQGNQLHSRGQYLAAANKYMLAKNNLKGIPSSKGGTLQLQCSLNLMSCYLKTGQFDECVKEGSEVLVYDSKNLKAFYRRGQAYKELGNLEAAVSDLSMAHELSPEDETIADMFRDVNEKLIKDGDKNVSKSLVIEEIEDEKAQPNASESKKSSPVEYSLSQPVEADECFRNGGSHVGKSTDGVESLQSFKDNPETVRLFQNYVSNANPETLAAMGVGGMPPDMVKTATDMIGKMKPEDLQKMLQAAASLKGKNPSLPTSSNINGDGSNFISQVPEMTPEMVKMASDRLSTMSPEDLQKMLDIASSMNVNGSPFSSSTTDASTRKSEGESTAGSQLPAMTPEMIKMASDSMRKMSPEELQKMFEIASSMNVNSTPFPAAPNRDSSQISESESRSTAAGSRSVGEFDARLTSTGGVLSNSRADSSSLRFPASPTDMNESMRNSMKDPAMSQMFTSMMKNISPEMMANMSEQFGMKLSREDAEKLQQQMSSLRPEDLDKMMRWAERAQRGVEAAKKTKNWVLGRPGLILAIVMLVLAVIFHQLGFIGG